MNINKESAIKLWNKHHGKETKVNDFAGREIHLSAYGDLNSKFGWNIDHIRPISNGGTDKEENLIIAHIETNSEKADKFPGFKANNKVFIVKKEKGVYKIYER